MLLTVLFLGCGPEPEEGPGQTYTACSLAAEKEGKCLRFMDRDVYFGNYVTTRPGENDVFHVQSAKDALREVEKITDLGIGYFRFHSIDPNQINPLTEMTEGEFKSFVLVWPDEKFNEFWHETGPHSDPNAVLVINKANKRQFYLVARAGCFEGARSCMQVTPDEQNRFTTEKGLRALFARQLARMAGGKVVSCDGNEEHLMCADFPSDKQWGFAAREDASLLVNNLLEAVSNTPEFYREFFLEQ